MTQVWLVLILSADCETGTGLVHTAPAHGVDDYLACKSNGIGISPLTVDERGMFTQNAPAQLVDLKVRARLT